MTCSGGPFGARGSGRPELVGRNVIEGRWTFQIVEEYDAGYDATLTDL